MKYGVKNSHHNNQQQQQAITQKTFRLTKAHILATLRGLFILFTIHSSSQSHPDILTLNKEDALLNAYTPEARWRPERDSYDLSGPRVQLQLSSTTTHTSPYSLPLPYT
uniref:Uncharacterized protein n=1 Tax=Glossina austeni TaxID=7395 RepID=A0A1A9VIC9_GLOAU